jgi:hypothetical protein
MVKGDSFASQIMYLSLFNVNTLMSNHLTKVNNNKKILNANKIFILRAEKSGIRFFNYRIFGFSPKF